MELDQFDNQQNTYLILVWAIFLLWRWWSLVGTNWWPSRWRGTTVVPTTTDRNRALARNQ